MKPNCDIINSLLVIFFKCKIVYDLVHDINVNECTAKIEEYKRKNAASISLNQAKLVRESQLRSQTHILYHFYLGRRGEDAARRA
jgi:hypothetical protein